MYEDIFLDLRTSCQLDDPDLGYSDVVNFIILMFNYSNEGIYRTPSSTLVLRTKVRYK